MADVVLEPMSPKPLYVPLMMAPRLMKEQVGSPLAVAMLQSVGKDDFDFPL